MLQGFHRDRFSRGVVADLEREAVDLAPLWSMRARLLVEAAEKLRRAKKAHRCTEASYHTIKPGDLYLNAAMAPWHEMNSSRKSDPGGKRWVVIKACIWCAKTYGMLCSGTRNQLEELRKT